MADDKKDDKKTATQATAQQEGKTKALGLALETIEKQFGKGSIMKLGDSRTMAVETISMGSISLDMALGGGIPRGRVIEIYGPEQEHFSVVDVPEIFRKITKESTTKADKEIVKAMVRRYMENP